jgi:hypothetical protein
MRRCPPSLLIHPHAEVRFVPKGFHLHGGIRRQPELPQHEEIAPERMVSLNIVEFRIGIEAVVDEGHSLAGLRREILLVETVDRIDALTEEGLVNVVIGVG